MWSAITEYWYLSVAFVVASILTVFVSIKAYQASAKARAEKDKVVERLRYENRTREEFAKFTIELIKTAPPQALLDGIALNIQAALEKESDMNAAFENLAPPQQYIYALYYLLLDGSEKLSEFFKINGKPLTPIAEEAVNLIFGRKAGELYNKEYEAFDEENEEISLIMTEIQETDQAFATFLEQNDVYKLVAEYIKQNANQLIHE
ncbi:MAG TPA: hypothetical protein VFD23_02435 [Clostridia bacterium]|nr:hypothetical protein [Clostridia bacterium]